ncbi:MAG: hypothetical protein Q8867_04690 [Bacteroidota bacterium]|nr:hypothetical protein [Bacteroidota bacterium]
MKRTDIEMRQKQITDRILAGRLKSSFDDLTSILHQNALGSFEYDLDSLRENYKNLLRYSFEGYKDPKRKEILRTLSNSFLALSDDAFLELRDRISPHKKAEKAMVIKEFGDDAAAVNEKIDILFFGKEIQKVLEEAGAMTPALSSIEGIFKLIWLAPKFTEDLSERILIMLNTGKLFWTDKCLIISALTLGLLDHFDIRKFDLLIEAVKHNETKVYQRALTGLLMGLIIYDDRIKHYPSIFMKVQGLADNPSIMEDMQAVLLQLLMAQETEKINKAFEEEVLPGMKKMMPRIEDKLELKNFLEESDIEGKNPGWEDLMDEVPGLFERIEKFTKMQMEGGDVFMATFSLLKQFDFFNRIHNWFIPYYPENPEIKSISGDEENIFSRLHEGLDKAYYLCNSDKYSFALNFNAVPQQQQSLILTYFESELEQMKEMESEDEILGQKSASNSIFIQYIQDLYRFFKLYSSRDEFDDFFGKKIPISGLNIFKEFFGQEKFAERLASFYFEKEHYAEAAEMYQYLSNKGTPKREYFEKAGYAFQKLKDFSNAIDQYRKAELFDGDRLWLLKKMGWCSLKIKDYKNATRYFEEAVRLQPDDLSLLTEAGQCYLNLYEFEKALQYFSKVRYFQSDNLKALRPVAWCNFVLGKLDEAKENYLAIVDSEEASPYDLIDAGHVLLCLGKPRDAVTYYQKALSMESMTAEHFTAAFEEDGQYLVKNGIAPEELPLISDYLLFRSEEK